MKFITRDYGCKSRVKPDFPCCICVPDHTFEEGEYSLLFPNAFGARKSAEIILNFDED